MSFELYDEDIYPEKTEEQLALENCEDMSNYQLAYQLTKYHGNEVIDIAMIKTALARMLIKLDKICDNFKNCHEERDEREW